MLFFVISNCNPSEKTMNISLTPELEKYVQEKVNSGLYTSASEVIRESLRLLHHYENNQTNQIYQLNQAIALGLSELSSGNKIASKDSYDALKSKLDKITKAQ